MVFLRRKDAILQMQLRRLTALEAEKSQEHEELQAQIADLQDIWHDVIASWKLLRRK